MRRVRLRTSYCSRNNIMNIILYKYVRMCVRLYKYLYYNNIIIIHILCYCARICDPYRPVGIRSVAASPITRCAPNLYTRYILCVGTMYTVCRVGTHTHVMY